MCLWLGLHESSVPISFRVCRDGESRNHYPNIPGLLRNDPLLLRADLFLSKRPNWACEGQSCCRFAGGDVPNHPHWVIDWTSVTFPSSWQTFWPMSTRMEMFTYNWKLPASIELLCLQLCSGAFCLQAEHFLQLELFYLHLKCFRSRWEYMCHLSTSTDCKKRLSCMQKITNFQWRSFLLSALTDSLADWLTGRVSPVRSSGWSLS